LTAQTAALNDAVILTTDRLKLRRFLPNDLEHFAALNANLEVMRYLGGAALTRAQSDSILLGADRSFAKSAFGKIAVERIEDRAFLDMCGLSVETWYPQDLEIGWRLARRHWGAATPARRLQSGSIMRSASCRRPELYR
jgi:RimJ/RimL family protein N-acetyltransferase